MHFKGTKSRGMSSCGGSCRCMPLDPSETKIVAISEDSNNIVEWNPDGYDIKTEETLRLVPRFDEDQVEILFVAGPSGCGKTTFISKYLDLYRQMRPENRIVIFSRKESDPNLDWIPNIERALLDESFLDFELADALDEFENSCCVFDDIETIANEKVKHHLYQLRDDLIKTGRDRGIYCVISNHQIKDRNKTRDPLNEASHIVIFPRASKERVRRFLWDAGVSKNNIKRILEARSRWVCWYRRYPSHVLTEHEVFSE